MDAVETRSNFEVRDIPPVPIKTYQWEDVRRAKTRGLYPYTHLTKDPYDREVDPEEYTMEAFRRSKSASTLGKGDSNVFIREITEEAPKTPSKDYLEVHPFSEGIVESAESSAAEDNISQYLDRDSDDRPEITEHVETPGTSEQKQEEKMEVDEENRAKSEEPKRKRKLSIESSYSRLSLSRLGMMKKLREAKEKLKLPKWSFSKSDSKLDVPKKPKKSKEAKSDRVEAKKVVGPLFVHIPLKPPPGETDEFSYLEFEDAGTAPAETKSAPPPLANGKQESETKEDAKSDIQLIILTAPSDDETLDDHVMMPDTPSSEKSKFFENTKIRELKSLAKDVVDEISPDTKVIFEDVIQVEYVDENNRPLATTENSKIIEVTEENLPNLERQLSQRNLKSLRKELRESRESLNKLVRQREREKLRAKLADRTESLPTLVTVGKESTPPKKTTENIMVDEEDGLKLSDEAVKLIGEELAAKEKASPKTEEEESLRPSASLKKKVSFKRRSKQEDPDGIYEDVQVTSDKSKDADEKEMKVLDASQSMSVDEEKTYLDGDKIIKTTSLEDDYHKWSKLPDHEYEPVNPPDEGKPQPQQQQGTPEVHVIAPSVDRDFPPKVPAKITGTPLQEEVVVQSDADDALTTEEMQARIEDRFFNATITAPPPPIVSSPPPPPTIVIEEPPEGQGKKIQDALRNQAEKIRSKFRNIKKPDMPKLPKIPDQVKVSLPSFTLPKRGGAAAKKRSLKERQLSTESNAGDSKKKLFDFSTYPRFFGKKKKKQREEDEEPPPPPPVESATVPRTKELFSRSRWGQKLADRRKAEAEELAETTKRRKDPDVVRIPLRPEEEEEEKEESDEEDASHAREDIDIDEAYLKENQEIHRAFPFDNDFSRNRWKLGSFHGQNLHEIDKGEEEYKITDLDQDAAESPPQTPPPQANVHSTSSSGDVHRRGVLEEINSDEFFLRQKGISQDDIEMGECLSWEIREAFRQPVNPLSQMQADDDDLDASDRSLQEQQQQKRKPIKKPKRKKTPHVSSEEVQESEPEEPEEQPPRPKRKSKKRSKEQTIPYQETIRIVGKDAEYKSVSDNVLNERSEDDRFFYRGGFKQDYPHQEMYENQRMTGIERPDILVSDPYERRPFRYHDDDVDDEDLDYVEHPEAPPRKNRSLKSLTSEHDSITDEIKYANQEVAKRNVEAYRIEHDYIIPISEGPPVKPARTRSRTRSQSRTTTQGDDDVSLPSKNGEDFAPERQPCVEEPCVRQLCDYMGYAIVDKSKQREPPLPPPVRRRRSKDSSKSSEGAKFFTVPRPLKDEAPVRPLRNYSTLVPKERRSTTNITDEEKENIQTGNLNQYIEIEEEGHSRVLKSGDVIQKMKDRPLPAPPRPPRKHKPILKDVTHEENIEEETQETEASVQTEPLPDDFVCEELVEDKNDKIMTPSRGKAVQDKSVTPSVDKTVNEFEHQETITHGALVVAPVPAGYQEGPLTSFSRSTERVVTVKRESAPNPLDDEETSQVPEEFRKLAEPEIKVLKTQKLQVGDLDVDRLTVNELLASKITVSEIDGGSIAVSEINPRSGNIVFAGVELPAGLLQELVQRLQAIQTSRSPPTEDDDVKTTDTKPEGNILESQIDTKPEENLLDEIESQIISDVTSPKPQLDLDKPMAQPEEESSEAESVPPLERGAESAEEEARLIEDLKRLSDGQKKTSFEDDDSEEPPQRPPRQSDYQRQLHSDSSEGGRRSETPPPRPPQPEDILETVYLRSQPPPSFYTMRSPVFHEIPADDIPLPPRRRRQQKTLSRSSSDEAPPRSRRHRTPPEASIPELAGQLTTACATAGEKALKRLIKHITSHVLQNTDGQQDTHVMVVILLVLIAGLILLGWGDGKTVHHHHWEYFNPPRDM